jgi:NAD+ kinase
VPSVLFVAFSNREDAVSLAQSLTTQLIERDVTATFALLDNNNMPYVTGDDLVVSLGGDGTFLRAARVAHQSNARVLGVDLGRVGFLLSTPVEAVVEEVLEALSSDKEEHRLALSVRTPNGDAFAFNEVVVERSTNGQMVRLQTYVDDLEYLLYTADGVLVATPTGSTGYNFSAGGPVVANELSVMVLTPIAPHFTIDRSVVLNGTSSVKLSSIDKTAVVLADGREICALQPNESVVIKQSSHPVRVVVSKNSALIDRLRKGLRDGHA